MERKLIPIDIAIREIGATAIAQNREHDSCYWLFRGNVFLRGFINYSNGFIDADDFRKWQTWMKDNAPIY